MSGPISYDPVLGRVMTCMTCDEAWPFDAEFWHIVGGRLSSSWPARCIACGADYYAERRRLAQHESRTMRSLDEAVPGRCNRVMHETRCGRKAAHRDNCRSTIAMSTEANAKRLRYHAKRVAA